METDGLKGKKVLVVGLGVKTGASAVRFLAGCGCSISVMDGKPAEALQPALRNLDGIAFELYAGEMSAAPALEADLLLLSPGVPRTVAPVVAAEEAGIEVIGDVELAWRTMPETFIGITGTDGKSTTTSMVGSILGVAGRGTVAGNIGIPVLSLVDTLPPGRVVCLELSSFQLESCPTFRPRVAAILNLNPDHLDRYDSLGSYLDAKLNIFRNQQDDDVAVLPLDDPAFQTMRAAVPAGVRVMRFSAMDESADALLRDGFILLQGRRILDVSEMYVRGNHNYRNALAAAAVCAGLGISDGEIRKGLTAYRSLPHRYEYVDTISGVQFINDSKATTLSAVASAIRDAQFGAAVLLGGKNKGLDFSALGVVLQESGVVPFYFGADGKAVRDMTSVSGELYETVEPAVQAAFAQQRERGEGQVILCPGGTSYDEFRNFEERGDFFKNLVRSLDDGS